MSKLKAYFFARLMAAGLCVAMCCASAVHAQSSSEDEQLIAAERALLEGLASSGGGAFQAQSERAAPQQPELQPATYSGPVAKPQRAPSADSAGEESAGIEERDLAPRNNPQPKRIVVKPQPQPNLEPSEPQHREPDSAAHTQNASLKRDLDASQRRVAELERQLEEVKGQLTMAETELSRLATIAEARNRASLGQMPAGKAPRLPVAAKMAASEDATPHIEPTPASSNDLTIATVGVDKAELRLGPGKNHSALMTVAKGSRLAVEARQGEWLRVFAPNGQRAWILAKLVAFGSKSPTSTSTSTVRVRGYSSSLEDDAFKRVQSLTGGR